MSLVPSKTGAIARRKVDIELMPPPPKRIKRPKNVIDEEAYTDAISEIIARDFFPGLLETESQQEYLDALDSKDVQWISSAGKRLQHVMTPGRRKGKRGTSIHTPQRVADTPTGMLGDTPSSVISDTTTATEPDRLEVDTNMSLDKFQSLYTSEDNESFYKLIDKQNKQRAEKYAWMWSANNKLPSKMMLKQKEVETKLLRSRSSLEDDGGERNRLAITSTSEKPAQPDGWRSRPNNEFMFAPDSIEDSLITQAQRSQNESRAAPKAVVHLNTRMPDPDAVIETSSIPASPSLSAVRDAISGHRRGVDTESGFSGSETPRVNGYAFVDDEPTEEPSTPPVLINLGKGQVTRNPFIIQQRSKREELHHRMVDKTAKSKRDSAKNGITGKVDMTPVPKFPSSPRVGGSGQLTPAAQRLWSKVGASSGPRSDVGFEQQRRPHTVTVKSSLQRKWTPVTK